MVSSAASWLLRNLRRGALGAAGASAAVVGKISTAISVVTAYCDYNNPNMGWLRSVGSIKL